MLKLIAITVMAFFFAAPVKAASTPLLSYKVWKLKKVDEAKSIVVELEHQMKKINNARFTETAVEEDKASVERKLFQAKLNLEVIRGLSANDYFVLYVAPLFKDDPHALLKAAKTLSPKEVADILGAYQKKLSSPEVVGIKTNPLPEDLSLTL